jgi:hypothetical protein
MGLARETILGRVASLTGGSTFDPLTPQDGQSFTVRSYVDGSEAYLEDVWAANDTSAFQLSIKSPRMHDDVKGILLASSPLDQVNGDAIFNPQTLVPGEIQQRLYSTDALTVSANGTAADKFGAVLNVRYQNLGGVSGRFATWEQIRGNVRNYLGLLVQPTSSATEGALGVGVALNSADQRLKADTDYALLGYTQSAALLAVVLNGVDLGNLNVGGPGAWDQGSTGDFFIKQSKAYDTPAIPVINSNNQGGTNVAIADIIGGTTADVTLIFAELRNKFPAATG